jgi:hypothetical protein
MKIAMVFSGRIKKYSQHLDNILNNIVQDNEVDFFLSHSPELIEDLDEFSRFYKPKIIINDPIKYKDYSKFITHDETSHHNVSSMLINRLRVQKAVFEYSNKNNINYDLVISYRFDLFCYNKLDLNYFLKEIQQNNNNHYLFIPSGDDYGGINDRLAIGSMYSISKYLQLYEKLDEIMESGNCIFHPEELLLYYMKTYCQDIVINRFNSKFEIKR